MLQTDLPEVSSCPARAFASAQTGSPRPCLPMGEKMSLHRQGRLPPACAGQRGGDTRLHPAGVVASHGPVLEPQWLLAVSVHPEAPLRAHPHEPSLLAPPQRACRPCSGHSGSRVVLGQEPGRAAPGLPAGQRSCGLMTVTSGLAGTRIRPRDPAPPVILGEKPITQRPPTGSLVSPVHCHVLTRGGWTAATSPPPAGPPVEGDRAHLPWGWLGPLVPRPLLGPVCPP